MPHKRETQMVCNLHFPTGTISEFRIWNRRAFQKRKPGQFPGRMKNSSYYCPRSGREATTSRTPRLHNKQGLSVSAIFLRCVSVNAILPYPHKSSKKFKKVRYWDYWYKNTHHKKLHNLHSSCSWQYFMYLKNVDSHRSVQMLVS